MIDIDIYNNETGDKWTINIHRVDFAYKYVIDIDKDGESFQKDGTIYNVDALSSLELVKIVIGTLDG